MKQVIMKMTQVNNIAIIIFEALENYGNSYELKDQELYSQFYLFTKG